MLKVYKNRTQKGWICHFFVSRQNGTSSENILISLSVWNDLHCYGIIINWCPYCFTWLWYW